jgi:hypothetical protein
MPLLLTAPALLDFCRRVRALFDLLPAADGATLTAETCKSVLAEANALLTRADAVAPITAPPPPPAWP